jgi:tRNA 2-selenouridine synthase
MGERIVADHRRILREGLPLIDLRAPTEFGLGAFPGAVNLPLLTDAERAAVGTRYKQCGQQAAIALGEELVSGATRTERVDSWRTFIATHPGTLLYCWRGGLRSQVAQNWLRDSGVEVARICRRLQDPAANVSSSDRGVLRRQRHCCHRRPDRFR